MPITGNIFSWGKNNEGQLGDNTKFSTLTGLYPDGFEDATIADYWTQNDLGGGGSFSESAIAGYLTITAGAGYQSSSNYSPTILYQIVNESDFRITAKMYFVDTINQATEQAGIVVTEGLGNADNKVGMRVLYSGGLGFKYLNSYHFHQTNENNRDFSGTGSDPLVDTSPIWMRISRTDGVIETFYSTDGINFVAANPESGFLVTSKEPLYVGLWACQNGSGNPFNVSFSDFEVVPDVDPQAVEVIGDVNFIDVAGGRNHSLGLKYDGSLWAWGDNQYGQLGDGTNISKSSPVAVQGNRRFVEISSSADHSMAIDVNGMLYGWGRNDYSQLGYAPPSGASVEELGEAGALIEISQELNYPFIFGGANQAGQILERSTGQLWTWGNNTFGQLGLGISGNQSSPMSVVGGHNFYSMSEGNNWRMLAIDTNGDAWIWGYCANHRCGTGNTTNRSTPTAVLALPGGVKALRPGTDLLCSNCNKLGLTSIANEEGFVIGENGTLYGWGLNNNGNLGIGSTASRTSPVALPAWGKVGHVSADYDNTFTIGWSDNLLGREELPDWGYRIRGFQTRGYLRAAGQGDKIGDWTTTNKSTPTLVCAPYEKSPCTWGWNVTWVDQGEQHVCAADIGKSGGRIFCWGYNQYGQLGDTSTTYTSNPVAVSGPTNDEGDWKDFSCGRYHTCALRASDGTAWCWGRGNVGQLGYGGVGNSLSPRSVLGNRSYVAIAATYETTFALDSDGLLWGWGNVYANFRNTSQTSPISVLAVQGKSSPYFPADEAQYLLGYLTNQASPVEIGEFQTAAAGLNHSLGIDSAGQVWAWGRNNKGQLGTGDLINRSSPVAVTGLPSKKFVKVSAGAEHSLAMTEDGDIYAWGDNTFSQVTSAGSQFTGTGNSGGSETSIILSTNEIITPDWYTDFSNYVKGAGITYGTGAFLNGFFCKYGELPAGPNCTALSTDWEHGEAWEAGQWGLKIIDPGDVGTTNKIGTQVARSKHSGSIDVGNALANRVTGNHPDQDILTLVKVHGDESNNDFMGISARLSNDLRTANPNNNLKRYTFSLNHGGDSGVRMWKQNAGSYAVIGQNTVPKLTAFCSEFPGRHRCPGYDDDGSYIAHPGYLWRNGDWMWIRFRIQGTTLKGVAWPYGYSMPRKWDLEVTDSDIDGSAGSSWGPYVSWGMLADTAGFFDFFAIAFNGKEVITREDLTEETGSEKTSPIQIPVGNYIDIDAGGYHNIVLDDNYRAWTWGRNDYGQLGDNSLDQKSSPVSVYGDHRFVDIAAGELHTYALKADGTICTWGEGDYGKLLHHTDQSARSIPHCGTIGVEECVNLLPNTGNYMHSTLLRCSSTWQAWTWGCNTDGKLGDGSVSNKSTPTQVIGNKKWIDMSGGGNHTIAIDQDGHIYAWGDDSKGQLGDG
jgi:alpha-tubulin suppressor-like RCC1 family protein